MYYPATKLQLLLLLSYSHDIDLYVPLLSFYSVFNLNCSVNRDETSILFKNPSINVTGVRNVDRTVAHAAALFQLNYRARVANYMHFASIGKPKQRLLLILRRYYP